uniref:SET domain-containing protein n=1 Tax=Mucochytrium quahogii TaxID=96639 RepID=A0A7S2S621_9STRA|mmetsp:Transcript_1683/g.2646  ORF Transcript_1683/g.2646 Transcript_1683/m.2646 type:complete len:2315 (-) Transcript_1683:2584-9528(-)|eukprot:CAMPEP_0203748218 /NCGR_PEP_ID=MMETSP0098-20131031/3156_1 /ASSEMBLY_ACC=CAM_ASM_000208 /TAXON_ID=96639 /ORGANISM=" , Strain NY0313808BC1" /LENGTH=2314 /DNA_ID=CAMNT_0050636883 /DNA_START=190 /DNA_END=7134 /DNA_ORIENTATION=+
MRKSNRGAKPSAKFLESKGVEIDGWTPTGLPDNRKLKQKIEAIKPEKKPVRKEDDRRNRGTRRSRSRKEKAEPDIEEDEDYIEPIITKDTGPMYVGAIREPLIRRYKALEMQVQQFKKHIHKLSKLDRVGILYGGPMGGPPAKKGQFTFSDLYEKLDKGEYYLPGIDEEDWLATRAALKLLRKEKKAIAGRRELKQEDFKKLNWDEFDADVNKMCTFVFANEEENTDPVSAWATAARISEFYAKDGTALRTKFKADMDKILAEEMIDRLSVENREPAMKGWRKTPYERRSYTMVNYYSPVAGLTEEEANGLMEMLQVGGENRWVSTDEFSLTMDTRSSASQSADTKRRKVTDGIGPSDTKIGADPEYWKFKRVGEGIIETETWGIDAFARRNILIALETVKGENRMTSPQISWFVEGMLLREINAQSPEVAFDLSHALRKIRRDAVENLNKKIKQEAIENLNAANLARETSAVAAKLAAESSGENTTKPAANDPPVENTTKVASGETAVDPVESTNAENTDGKSGNASTKHNDESEAKPASEDIAPTTKVESSTEKHIDTEEKNADNVSKDTGVTGDKEENNVSQVPEDLKADENVSKSKPKKKKSKVFRVRNKCLEDGNIIWAGGRNRKKTTFFEAAPKISKEEEAIAKEALKLKKSVTEIKADKEEVKKKKKKPAPKKKKAAPKRAPPKRKPASRKRKAESSVEDEEIDESLGVDDGKPVVIGEEIVGKRLSLFWKLDCTWYWGRVIKFERRRRDGKFHLIHYDDGAEEWFDISKERYMLEDKTVCLHDKNIPPQKIISAVDTILDKKSAWGDHNFCVHPKGVGIVADTEIAKGDMIGPYYGELYPLWLWEQKEAREDMERKKKTQRGKVSLPDFWNMRLELPRHTEKGFSMMYIDAKYHGTFTSRFSHSCRPNCGASLAVIDGKYSICVRALCDIEKGEELSIDYNCVTDSIDEFRAAICLCGTDGCRGSFLYITGAQQYMQVVNRRHLPVHRVAMLYEASYEVFPTATNLDHTGAVVKSKSKKKKMPQYIVGEDGLDEVGRNRLAKFGLKSLVLENLPGWLLRYSSLAMRFVELEQLELPARLFHEELQRRNNLVEGFIAPTDKEERKITALDRQITKDLWDNVQRESKGIASQRVSNLTIALNKTRHRMESRIRLGKQGSLLDLARRLQSLQGSRIRELASSSQGPGSPRQQSLEDHDKKLQALLADSDAKLVERVWWVDDTCEAKWCGDDQDEYPGWYPGHIVHVYSQGLHGMANQRRMMTHRKGVTTGPSIHFLYLTSDAEYMDRIPMTPEIVRRMEGTSTMLERIRANDDQHRQLIKDDEPSTSENGTEVKMEIESDGIKEENDAGDGVVTKMDVETKDPEEGNHIPADSLLKHQSPFRPLRESEIRNILWNDRKNSVVQRLLRVLEPMCTYTIKIWQCADDPRLKHPYWWNIETREVRRMKPPSEEAKETFVFTPKAFLEIRELANTYMCTSAREARVGLEMVRDTLLRLPALIQTDQLMIKQDHTLEEAHQKAIDLLTFYSNTKNYFVVREPKPIKNSINPWRRALNEILYGYSTRPHETRMRSLFSPETDEVSESDRFQASHSHESSVSASLLGWLDQKEQDLEISNLVGTAYIPDIETAYTPCETEKYLAYHRSKLMRQLGEQQKRYEEWDKDLRLSFPDVPDAVDPGSIGAWPPSVPPVKLYGSPIMDAAILDNREFNRLSLGLGGNLEDVYAKKVLEELEKPASNRGDHVFSSLVQALRNTRRNGSKSYRKEEEKFIPPPPPSVQHYIWVQCAKPMCERWRKLPEGMTGDSFPDPFYCEHLIHVDPRYASCTVPEEDSSQGETTIKWGFGINDVNDLRAGHQVDAFCKRAQQWFAADVIDSRPESVLVKYPQRAGFQTEWILKNPTKGELPMLQPLHAFTTKRVDEKEETKLYKFVDTVRKEKSKFGKKATIKEYTDMLEWYKIENRRNHAVPIASVMAHLVNEVSALGGEKLGMIHITGRRRVPLNKRPRSSATGISSAGTSKPRGAKAREGILTFFKDLKQSCGQDLTFREIAEIADNFTPEQIELWNPANWQNSPYACFLDSFCDEDIGCVPDFTLKEEEEVGALKGMEVRTPVGVGTIVSRTGIRSYLVAVKAYHCAEVNTPYGKGNVVEIFDNEDGEPIVKVKLSWGANIYIHDLAIVHEMYLSVPFEAFVSTRLAGVDIEDVVHQIMERRLFKKRKKEAAIAAAKTSVGQPSSTALSTASLNAQTHSASSNTRSPQTSSTTLAAESLASLPSSGATQGQDVQEQDREAVAQILADNAVKPKVVSEPIGKYLGVL